jgi:hypothetical protein
MNIQERIEELEQKLKETAVNKATETERGRLKSRIAELKKEKKSKQKGTGDTSGYAVEKEGDRTVSLVGFPSVGKSSLLNKITNAESETGAYEFTTLDVTPGMLEHSGAKIQILDVPGLIGGAADGRGDGSQVLSVVRNSDLVIVMLDPEEMREEQIKQELYDAGIRLDSSPPKIEVKRKERGGIQTTGACELDEETVEQIAKSHGYQNAIIRMDEEISSVDRLIDGLMDNRKYVPSLTVVNKCDMLSDEKTQKFKQKYDKLISCKENIGLEDLKQQVVNRTGLISVYMVKDGDADKEEPLIIGEGSTVEDALRKLPGNMDEKFKHARVSGTSADFPDQRVGMSHVLEDGDRLSLSLKRV